MNIKPIRNDDELRKRPLSLRMVKRLQDGLRIPYESLLAGVV